MRHAAKSDDSKRWLYAHGKPHPCFAGTAMIPPVDITPDIRDISQLWNRLTGDDGVTALAHMRSGSLVTVTVQHERTLAMCRAGAIATLSAEAVRSIEEQGDGRRGWVH